MQDRDVLHSEAEPWWNWDHLELIVMGKLCMQMSMHGTMVSKTNLLQTNYWIYNTNFQVNSIY